jgi:hypothetical protein
MTNTYKGNYSRTVQVWDFIPTCIVVGNNSYDIFFNNIPKYLQSVLHGHSVNLLICLVTCGIHVQ